MATIQKLIEDVQNYHINNREYFVNLLAEKQTISELKNSWQTGEYITPANKKKNLSIVELKEVILARFDKLAQKRIEKEINELNEIFNSGTIEEISVSIEWKASRTWGANPTATVKIFGSEFERLNSGSVSGCGYDKESTAFADAINQSKAFRKMLFENSEKIAGKYGHSNGKFNGGVGTSCYYSIFEALGYKMSKVGSGKWFDVYNVVKVS